jgi:flagellar basal body-associated protein FliL
LGGADASPGTQLANIGNMPDVQPDAAPESGLKKKKKNKWPAILLVLALVLMATGIFVGLRPEPSTSAAEGAAESTLALETFVVNLTGSGQRAYLRVGITLGLARALPRKQAEAVPTALVRDTVLSVLATAQPEDLLKLEGKRQLKDELLKALQDRVPQLAVENVYFTEFLVQM